jgi:hypothetical protein
MLVTTFSNGSFYVPTLDHPLPCGGPYPTDWGLALADNGVVFSVAGPISENFRVDLFHSVVAEPFEDLQTMSLELIGRCLDHLQ